MPIERMESALDDMLSWLAREPANELGNVIIRYRQIIDRTEAACAEATRRFDKAGGYKAVAPWGWWTRAR